MSFSDDVADPLYFATHLPDFLYLVLFQRQAVEVAH